MRISAIFLYARGSFDNIIAVFTQLEKYKMDANMETLLPDCERYLQEPPTVQLACVYYELALKFDYSLELIQKIERAICEHAPDVLKTESFAACGVSTLKRILQLNYMICSEHEIFVGAMAWATKSCERKNLSTSPENLRTALG